MCLRIGLIKIGILCLVLLTTHLVLIELAAALESPNPEAFMSVPQIISRHGYPVEIHKIQTKDGYILEGHRIPYSKKSPKGKPKRVVYLAHGLTASSACWVTNDPDKNWGYWLADAGYDVWMVNNRGNFYSRNHVYLSPAKSEFWNFTLTEIGTHDFPCIIDYILTHTGHSDLYYIGHSMGTTGALIGTSVYPKYNAKIRLSVHLAPTAFCKHMRSPIRYFSPLEGLATDILQGMSHNVPLGELNPNNYFLSLLRSFACNIDAVFKLLCQNLYFLLFGFDTHQLSRERVPVYMGHLPAGSSVYAQFHYGQLANTGRFSEYDWRFGGPVRDFDLTKVTHKVALYWGDNDWLADPRDVARLARELPNLVGNFQVKYKGFTHIDFIWGTHMVDLLIKPVIKFMAKY